MGKKSKSKTSRKGKREWRKNIGTAEVDALVEHQAQVDRSGGPLEALPSEDLFFVDISKDAAHAARKVDKHRAKILHADSILARNSLIPVLKQPSSKKRKDRDHALPPGAVKAKEAETKLKAVQAKPESASKELGLGFYDAWEEIGKAKKVVKRETTVTAPAVEVDMPGCSYNPSFDDHQEALGAAVADEMKKVINRELQPEPVQVHVAREALTEEDMFFLDVDKEEEGESEEEEAPEVESKSRKMKKLTRADLNRKARRREVLKAEAEKLKKQKMKAEIQQLPEIAEGIKEEDEEKERRRIRRIVSREEKRAAGPPRLGRHRFKPEPKQVLLSSEVTGSLRKLKAYPVLIRDRFRSLQRRGIVETRVPVKRKEKKKWVEIKQGTRGDREREMHAAMLAEKEALKQGLAVLPL